jgi:hypothetical protein
MKMAEKVNVKRPGTLVNVEDVVVGPGTATERDLEDASYKMTDIFLDWLEEQAKTYAVSLDEGPVDE